MAVDEGTTTKRRRRRTAEKSPIWLSPQAAASLLDVSVSKIYQACATGQLKHAKLGHSTIRIRPSWLDEWAESLAS